MAVNLKILVLTLNKIRFLFLIIGLSSILFYTKEPFLASLSVDEGALKSNYEVYNANIPFENTSFLTNAKKSQIIKQKLTENDLEWSSTFFKNSKSGKDEIIHGVLRSALTDSKESIALVFKYEENNEKFDKIKKNSSNLFKKDKNFSGIHFAFNFISYLKKVKWLSKDIIFVFVPNKDNLKEENDIVKSWLSKYLSQIDILSYDVFPRAGNIIAALILDLKSNPFISPTKYALKMGTKLGTLPNMDLPALIFKNAQTENLHFTLFDKSDFNNFCKKLFFDIENSAKFPLKIIFNFLGVLTNFFKNVKNFINFDYFGNFYQNLAKFKIFNEKIDVFSIEKMREYLTMFQFVAHQIFNSDFLIDSDSAFLMHGIDSITIKSVKSAKLFFNDNFTIKNNYKEFFIFLTKTIRSLSDLHEKLHHSTFMFIATSTFTYVRYSKYAYSIIVLIIPLLLKIIELNLNEKINFYSIRVEIFAISALYFICFALFFFPFLFDLNLKIDLIILAVSSIFILILYYFCYNIEKEDFYKGILGLLCAMILFPTNFVNFPLAFFTSIFVNFLLLFSSKTFFDKFFSSIFFVILCLFLKPILKIIARIAIRNNSVEGMTMNFFLFYIVVMPVTINFIFVCFSSFLTTIFSLFNAIFGILRFIPFDKKYSSPCISRVIPHHSTQQAY